MFQITFQRFGCGKGEWFPHSKSLVIIRSDIDEARLTLKYLCGLLQVHFKQREEDFKKPEVGELLSTLVEFMTNWCNEQGLDLFVDVDLANNYARQAFFMAPDEFADWFLNESAALPTKAS